MLINVGNNNMVLFSLKRRPNPSQIIFKNEPLEVTHNYKYLGLEFNEWLNWESCTRKRLPTIQSKEGSISYKTMGSLVNASDTSNNWLCINQRLYYTKTKQFLFQTVYFLHVNALKHTPIAFTLKRITCFTKESPCEHFQFTYTQQIFKFLNCQDISTLSSQLSITWSSMYLG